MTKRLWNEETGEDKVIVVGFKGLPVFGLEQTEGKPLPSSDPDIEKWVASLPLLDVAKSWGLSVEVFDGQGAPYLGCYRLGLGIDIGVKNLLTWTHELVHAGDHRNGTLKERGQRLGSECVAELGGAVLLEILGYEREVDLGGCWDYIQSYAQKEKMGVTEACIMILERMCMAVSLILETAEQIKRENPAPTTAVGAGT